MTLREWLAKHRYGVVEFCRWLSAHGLSLSDTYLRSLMYGGAPGQMFRAEFRAITGIQLVG